MTSTVDRVPSDPRVRARAVLVPVGVVVAVVAVLAAAVWSLVWATGRPEDLGPGRVAVADGLARVDRVTSAARPGMAMPGMGTDQDPVAEGMRRVSVDVTLQATGDDPLRFEVRSFHLEVADEEAAAPHRSVLPESVLPPGTQLSGTLVFEVPVDTTTAVLSYDGGGGTEVRLPPEAEPDTGHRAPAHGS